MIGRKHAALVAALRDPNLFAPEVERTYPEPEKQDTRLDRVQLALTRGHWPLRKVA